MDSLDNALQLLLIIDYIVDWARDIYREGVAQSLKKLAAHDSRSLAHDTDIFSMARHIEDWASAHYEREATRPPETQATEDPLRQFDSQYGVIRDSRFIRTRFIGLYITEENFQQLMDSTSFEKEAKKLASSLLACLKKSCRLKRSVLDEYEHSWTGMDRSGLDISPPDAVFLTVFTAISYLTSDWDQVRELSYVAIAETLVDKICAIAGVQRVSPDLLAQIPSAESMPPFKAFLQCRASDHLRACMTRRCLQTVHSPPTGRDPNYAVQWKLSSSKKGKSRQEPQREMAIAVCFQSAARELVYSLYLKHKIGRIEPTSPIFRLSTQRGLLSHPEDGEERSASLSNFAWPGASQHRGLDTERLIILNSHSLPEFSNLAQVCIFLMDPCELLMGISEEYVTDVKRVHLALRRFEGGLSSASPTNGEITVFSSSMNSGESFHLKLRRFLKHLKSTKHRFPLDGNGSVSTGSDQAKQEVSVLTQWECLTGAVLESDEVADEKYSSDGSSDTDSSNDSWMEIKSVERQRTVVNIGSSPIPKKSRRKSSRSKSKRKEISKGKKRLLSQICDNNEAESSSAKLRRAIARKASGA